jgi:phenylpropionate dioxygenase-like ring-hydroxylating dioxygenase large terminal subunit
MQDPLFSEESYSQLRKPLLEASGLPPGCYTSAEFYRREIEYIFRRHWQFVGREEELPRIGSYFCFDGPAGPVIVQRGANDEIRAFANSCRHRGARLLNGSGACKRIVCPYHGWVYRHDGRLIGAPGMQGVANFELADFPLLELPLARWSGFIFIHYQASPPPFAEHVGNMPDLFDGHRGADMRLAGKLEFYIRSNWKLLAENALEAYHTGSVHRDTLGQQDSCAVQARGGWTGLLVEDEHSVATLPGDDKPFPHIEGLGAEAASGAWFTLLYPSTQLVFAQDCLWWLAFRPLAVDRTQLTIGACFPRATLALDGFGEQVRPYFARWREATAEDNAICEQQQLGQANARSPGRYAASEFAVHAFDNWVVDQVLGG